MSLKVSNLFKKKRTLAIWLIISFVLIGNTIAYVNDSTNAQNTMNDIVSFSSSNLYSFKYPYGDLSMNLEVFNHSVFQLNNYTLTEYTFDPSFGKISSEQTKSIELPKGFNAEVGPVKFTTNGNQSLILQNQNQQNQILHDESQTQTNFAYTLHPLIFELGKLHSSTFTTVQSTLNIACPIPNYYKTILNANICYARDIEFLNSSTLLVLQDYGNQNNITSNGMLNNYGASLVFYNLQINKTMKIIPLQNAESIDYSYIYTPENTNKVLLYYTDKSDSSQGYMALNLNNYKIQPGYGNNIKKLFNGNYGQRVNQPLLIHTKFLVIYITSQSQLTFAWYSVQPDTLVLKYDLAFYFIILVVVLFILREAWLSKLKNTYNFINNNKLKKELKRSKEYDKDLIEWLNEKHIQYRDDDCLIYENPGKNVQQSVRPTAFMIPNCKKLNLFNLKPQLQLIPRSIGKLTGLEQIILDSNQLRTLPEEIGQLINLVSITLTSNQLVSIPVSIGKLEKLQLINLTKNNLTELPSSMGSLFSLKRLELSENKLKSVEWLNGTMKELEFIDISYNEIDFLPESIGDLSNLRYLSIKSNHLNSLPDSIGKLEKLEELRLSDNNLVALPESIGKLKNLKKLYLGYNRIEFLPESIGKLINLEYLSVPDNPLTELPESIYKLQLISNRLQIHGI